MTQKIINIGTPNKGDGDPLRNAFDKINQNFTELYNTASADVQLPSQAGNNGKVLTTNGTTLSWITVNNIGAPTVIDGGSATTTF